MKHFLFIAISLIFGQSIIAQTIPVFPAKKVPPKPVVKHVTTNTTAIPSNKFILKIICNTEAKIMVDGEMKGVAKPGIVFKIGLDRGVYRIEVFSLKYKSIYAIKETYRVENNFDQDLWPVELKELEKKLIYEEFKKIIESCLLSIYKGSIGDDHFIENVNVISNYGNEILFENRYEYILNKKNYVNRVFEFHIDLSDIVNFEFKEVDPENIKYEGTNRELLLTVVEGRSFFVERDLVNDKYSKQDNLKYINIVIRAECESDLNSKLNVYFKTMQSEFIHFRKED